MLAVLLFAVSCQNASGPPPVYEGALPNFSLMAEDGSEITKSTLAGKVVVLDFGFINCPSVCVRTLENIRAANQQLGGQVVFYRLSIIPDRETVDQARNYVERVKVPNFHYLLTANRSRHAIDAVGDALGALTNSGGEGDGAYQHHDGRIFLFDKEGKMRGFYNFNIDPGSPQAAAEIAKFVRDAKFLL